jgi:antitoxin component YwqK of YwqJK toxin-antitoxin module
MKIYLAYILLFCICYTNHITAQTVKKVFWENGNLKSEGASTAAALKVGQWKYYYSNGKLEAEGTYLAKAGRENTPVFRARKTSAIQGENSPRDGQWTFYYSSGAKKAAVIYKEGCPTGLFTSWYKTGEKKEERSYEACNKITSKKIWAKAGWLKFETVKEDEMRSVEVEWYKNGQKKSAIPYKKGKQYGRVKRWYPNGQKEEDVMMKNTRVHGYYRSWHSNGKKKHEFFSINNVMSGDYFDWNENGALIWQIQELKDENKISVVNYWENGQIKMTGKSKMPTSLSIHEWSQSRDGQWTYYYKDGKVIKGESYLDGRLQNVEMP